VRKSDKGALSVTAGTLGAFAALMMASPSALADPEVPPPAPPLLPAPALPGPALPGPGDQSITTEAAAGDPAVPVDPAAPPAEPAPPTEVQHLSSPTNLPPGTTDVPIDQGQGRTTSYLRDLFHAYQTQEISGKDAILLLTQRPLDPNAMPTNGMPTGPQAPPGTPLPQGAPALDAPLPQGAPAPDAPLPQGAPAPDALLPQGAPAPEAPPPDAPPPGPLLPGLAPLPGPPTP
jgi:hypothetical protein